MDDEPPIHQLLTAPLIAGGEKRLITQGFEDDTDPPRECEIRGGIALIPAIAFKSLT